MSRRTPSPIARPSRRRIAFGWYGGKFSHLGWLLPLLPEARRYVEPFGGSGAVLLNREPAEVETYNDLDGEVCHFFRTLRDHHESLSWAVALTPFSREEFALLLEIDPSLPDVERARRFFVRARQVRTGLAQSATLGRWADCKDSSRRGMAGVVSRWRGAVEGLAAVAERLLRVQIDNRPALEILANHDSPDTLFYCDPPYLHESRGDPSAYAHEMSGADHGELAEALDRLRGRVAVSGYDHPTMARLYPAPRWTRREAPAKACHSSKSRRTECLWTNY